MDEHLVPVRSDFAAGDPVEGWSGEESGEPAAGGTSGAPWHVSEVLIVVLIIGVAISMVTGIVTGATSSIDQVGEAGAFWRDLLAGSTFFDQAPVILMLGAAVALAWWRVGQADAAIHTLPDEGWESEFHDSIRRLLRLRTMCTVLVVFSVTVAVSAVVAAVSLVLYLVDFSSNAPAGGLVSQYAQSGFFVVDALAAGAAAWAAWYVRDRCTDALNSDAEFDEDEGGLLRRGRGARGGRPGLRGRGRLSRARQRRFSVHWVPSHHRSPPVPSGYQPAGTWAAGGGGGAADAGGAAGGSAGSAWGGPP